MKKNLENKRNNYICTYIKICIIIVIKEAIQIWYLKHKKEQHRNMLRIILKGYRLMYPRVSMKS